MRLLLRLLTLVSWFLPFTFFLITCDGSNLRSSYNKKEAAENIKLDNKFRETLHAEDSLKDEDLGVTARRDSVNSDSEKKSKTSDKLLDQILSKVIMPTRLSVSIIGATFYF